MKRKNKGITLISLVVTIIILLILSGIVINLTIGKKGILIKGWQAKDETEKGVVLERVNLVIADYTIEKATNKVAEDYFWKELIEQGVIENKEEDIIGPEIDENGNKKYEVETTDDYTVKIIIDSNENIIEAELTKTGKIIPTPEGDIESDWDLLSQISNAIKNNSGINANSLIVQVEVGGNKYKVKVGDIHKLKYNGEIREVRIIGFKHDDLTDGSGKAGITFDFKDFMTGTTNKKVNTNHTNVNGWGATQIRTFLNGSEGIGKLSNQSYIKQVKKEYIKKSNDPNSTTTCEDKLWLLSCAEIWNEGGYVITHEGKQYLWYKMQTDGIEYKAGNPKLKKYSSGSTQAGGWWLRSPYSGDFDGYCIVSAIGSCNAFWASDSYRVAPGFCI